MAMDDMTTLGRALAVLGPLEARIMGEIWRDAVPERFMVRDVRARMPELAHTTVMTMLNRLADKGLLTAERMGQRRATYYRVHWTPEAFLVESGRRGTEEFVRRYGDAALAAFAARLDALTPEQRERLRKMGAPAP
jgi:predicted transcriptional regulator